MRRLIHKTCILLLFISVSVLFMAGGLHAAPAGWVPPPALAQIIAEGIANNQGLKSQTAKVEGLKAEALAAGALDDPRVGFGLLNLPVDSFSFHQEPMTQKQVSFAQKFPWPGKLALKSQSAALKAAKETAVLKDMKLNLVKAISTTYYDLGFVHRSLEINGRLSDMVRRLLRISETRYSVGKGLQQDVLQAQVELSRLLDEGITLKQKRRTLEKRINELLSRSIFLPIPMPENLTLPDFDLDMDSLKAWGLAHNPDLVMRKLDIEISGIEVDLARKGYYPDFDVKFAYGQREEDRMGNHLTDFASASMMMNIPLWKHKKQDNKLAAAKKKFEAKEAAYMDFSRRLAFQIESLVDEINSTRENYRLYNEGVLAQAEQWAKSSQSAYQVNRIEFNTMINSQIRLLRFRLQKEKYLYQLFKQRANLVELIGGTAGEQAIDKEEEK